MGLILGGASCFSAFSVSVIWTCWKESSKHR